MKKFILALVAVAATSSAFAADWEKPELLAVTKRCGSVMKGKTNFDGVQVVFSEKNRSGKAIDTYYLSAVGAQAQSAMAALKEGESKAACVVGLPSSLPAGAILVDSPNSFLTLQLVQ